MFFFSVQVCFDPWTVLRQADLQRYLFCFWGGKGMFLCFYVKKIVPVDITIALRTNILGFFGGKKNIANET
jgi:hypothetical protein